jgi:hypothetical protein
MVASFDFSDFYVAEAVRCLNLAVNLFLEIGRLSMAAKHCKVMQCL